MRGCGAHHVGAGKGRERGQKRGGAAASEGEEGVKRGGEGLVMSAIR